MRGLASFLISMIFLSGCQDPRGFQSASGTGAASPRPEWSPESFHLTCENGSCPAQVGLIVFVFPLKGEAYPIKKCTGFLAQDASTIYSNGHCDFTEDAVGYFITADSAPGGRQVIPIRRNVKKKFTAGLKRGDENEDSLRPDMAIFQLDRPVEGMTALEFAAMGDPSPKELIGYVVNGSEKDGKFSIQKISCMVHRHEAFFPFSLSEGPDVIKAYGCASHKTNSGSPLFAPGREDRVEAIVQSNTLTDSRVFGRMPSIVATNARCFQDGSRCFVSNFNLAEEKFRKMNRDRVAQLAERPAPDAGTNGVRYEVLVYPIAKPLTEDQEFEIFYKPVCRTTDQIPSTLAMLSEHVTLRYDEWASLRVENGDLKSSEFKVEPVRDQFVKLDGQWFNGFAPLQEPNKHPRALWGTSFPFELPKCLR